MRCFETWWERSHSSIPLQQLSRYCDGGLKGAYPTTFFALARVQFMSMASTHDFVECKRHAVVRRRVDFKLCVEGARLAIVALVSRIGRKGGC